MGLDQYLLKKTYVKDWDHDNKNFFKVTTELNGNSIQHIQPKRISYIIEEVANWRKANHIHKWFVDNVQDGNDDCGEYTLSIKLLTTLKDTCKEALNAFEQKDFDALEDIMPTYRGHFFGSYEYDEYYKQELVKTIQIIKQLEAENRDWRVVYTYSSSW